MAWKNEKIYQSSDNFATFMFILFTNIQTYSYTKKWGSQGHLLKTHSFYLTQQLFNIQFIVYINYNSNKYILYYNFNSYYKRAIRIKMGLIKKKKILRLSKQVMQIVSYIFSLNHQIPNT